MKRFAAHIMAAFLLFLSNMLVIPAAWAVGPTASGYQFTSQLNAPIIYVFSSVEPRQGSNVDDRFPPSATLTVAVTDTSGKPVAGVPVRFEVQSDSMLKNMISITPQQATTNAEGQLQATVETTTTATTGAGEVLVWVDGMKDDVTLSLKRSPVRAN